MFDVVIVNDDLERAYDELKAILNEVSQPLQHPRLFSFLLLYPVVKVGHVEGSDVEELFVFLHSGNPKSSGSQVLK